MVSQMGESKTSMSFDHCRWCHRWVEVKLACSSITVMCHRWEKVNLACPSITVNVSQMGESKISMSLNHSGQSLFVLAVRVALGAVGWDWQVLRKFGPR